MKRSRLPTIRTLRHDEPLPDGEPKRYRDGRGYIRLRWKVATSTYVEEYEHRIVAGRPHPRFDVHHLNGDKQDNRRENLRVLTREEHAALHQQDRPPGRYGPYRSRDAMEKAQRAKDRRRKRDALREDIREMYESGMTTVEIAGQIGIDASGVSRHLRAAGGRGRTGPTPAHRRDVQARARMRCERCAADLTWSPHQIHHRKPRQMGGTPDTAEANRLSNLLLLCGTCHDHIESHRDEAYRHGWLVHRRHDPAEVWVLRAGVWVMLTDTGEVREVRP